jgi:hypothetical protein
MDITELFDFDISALVSTADHKRTPGLHLSGIIKRLARARDPQRFGGEGGPDPVRMLGGLVFEDILEQGLAKRDPTLVRPGELKRDGIIGSPDGLSQDQDGAVIQEYKFTWMSSRHGLQSDRLKHYIEQIKGYCCMQGARRAILTILFVNDDYRSFQPKMRRYRLDFEAWELDDFWNMVLREAPDTPHE